jgi:hypothetical protein
MCVIGTASYEGERHIHLRLFDDDSATSKHDKPLVPLQGDRGGGDESPDGFATMPPNGTSGAQRSLDGQ